MIVLNNKIPETIKDFERLSEKARFLLSQQILDDSNIYAKMDKGTLIASSYIASDLQGGLLIWNTPYAKRQYFTGTPSTDRNKNASLLWVQVARSKHAKQWLEIMKKVYEKYL